MAAVDRPSARVMPDRLKRGKTIGGRPQFPLRISLEIQSESLSPKATFQELPPCARPQVSPPACSPATYSNIPLSQFAVGNCLGS